MQLMRPLTQLEQQTLELAAQGLSAKQIAKAQHKSPRTVTGRLQNIYFKLGATNRNHAIALGFRHNILHGLAIALVLLGSLGHQDILRTPRAGRTANTTRTIRKL